MSTTAVPGWRLALGAAALVGYALLSHWMMSRHPTAPWAVAVLLGPLWTSTFALVPARHARWGYPALAVAGVAGGVALAHGPASNVRMLYLLQHAGVHLALGVWFAASLRATCRLSLIGLMAERVHRTLTPAMRRYTGQVTAVWVAYFFGMAVVSLVLYASAPFAAWSVFANVVTPVVAVAVFVGEYVARYRLHPEFERASMADAVRAFRERAATP